MTGRGLDGICWKLDGSIAKRDLEEAVLIGSGCGNGLCIAIEVQEEIGGGKSLRGAKERI